jgi:penicillin-binding protein 1A
VAGAAAVAVLAAGCANTHDLAPIKLPTNAAPSRILDAKGRLITTIGEENRENVPLSRIPLAMQQATVAIEDSRFWSHRGVDVRGIVRAAEANARAGAVEEGGSTITQQYVKNALLDDEQSISRKIDEATTAIAIERAYSKDLILEQYLNTVYFGAGAYGVAAAARTYFGGDVGDLTLPQAATLAGLLQSPARYDPRSNPARALERRNEVLRRMESQGYITAEQHYAAALEPVTVVDGAGPTDPTQQRYPAAHFVEEVKKWLLTGSDALGDNQAERYDNLLRGGLTITTTIDLDLQAKAEATVAKVLPGQGSDSDVPDAALASVEPSTGFVRAMVGGHDFWGGHPYAKTNLAEGKGRGTGSAFKPIVMATALANGVGLDEVFSSPPTATFRIPGSKPWTVKGGHGLGQATMGPCVVFSSNTCFANIMLDARVGPEKSVTTAQAMGVTHTTLEANPAAVLGTNDATVLDMASVYATFADGGVHVPPAYVTRVDRPDGTVLYQHQHAQSKVLEPEVARAMNDILPGVLTEGTAAGKAIDWPAGGKTGTNQNNTDLWFCGYTAQLSTAVWTGFSEPVQGSDGTRRLRSMPGKFGADYPAEIWQAFMASALDGAEPLPLNPPEPPPTTTTAPPEEPAVLTPVTAPPGKRGVPDVTGMTASAASAALKRAGFAVEATEVDLGPTATPGVVSAQSPEASTALAAGATVWVEVTKGHPASKTPVPDLRGFGVGQATSQLQSLGFSVSTAAAVPPAGTLSPSGQPYVGGQVWRTSPAAGELSADGTVRLDFLPQSASPSTTTIPATTTTTRKG